MSKVTSIIFKVLACLWVALDAIGLFAKLYLFIRADGLFRGFQAWGDWLDPYNALNALVRMVELSPALLLFWLGSLLDKRRANRLAETD